MDVALALTILATTGTPTLIWWVTRRASSAKERRRILSLFDQALLALIEVASRIQSGRLTRQGLDELQVQQKIDAALAVLEELERGPVVRPMGSSNSQTELPAWRDALLDLRSFDVPAVPDSKPAAVGQVGPGDGEHAEKVWQYVIDIAGTTTAQVDYANRLRKMCQDARKVVRKERESLGKVIFGGSSLRSRRFKV